MSCASAAAAAPAASLAMDSESAIRTQVEYYFSDRNLNSDPFFSNLIARNEGWVDVDSFLSGCKRLTDLKADKTNIALSLSASSELEVESTFAPNGSCSHCRLKRRRPFVCQAVGKGNGNGKGNDSGNCKSKGKSRDQSPLMFENVSPCGYYLAGHCCYRRCPRAHSAEYALAIRRDWLCPGNSKSQATLRELAEEVLGADQVAQAKMFPRVFSTVLTGSMSSPQRGAASVSASDGDSGPGRGRGGDRTREKRWNAAEKKSAATTAEPEEDGFEWERSEAQQLPKAPSRTPRYLLVFDLEGKQEIIEFPLLVLDTKTKREVGRFQRFVAPAKLFQGKELVTDAPGVPFQFVLEELDEFLKKTIKLSLNQLTPERAIFLTCGDWDCNHVHTQCKICRIPVPHAFDHWVNIKRTYSEVYGGDFRGMKSMLARLGLLDSQGGLRFGFHHLGMHDVENISRCALRVLEDGFEITKNGERREKPGWQ